MPTYEYECRRCGAEVEFFQSITDGPKRKCPACGNPRGLRRKIGAGAGIIFRGSGFYETDYRSAAYKKAAEADRPSTSSSGDGDGAKASKGSKASGTGDAKDDGAS